MFRHLGVLLTLLSAASLLLFLYLFVAGNLPGLSAGATTVVIAVVYGVLFTGGGLLLVRALKNDADPAADNGSVRVVRLLLPLIALLLVWVFLDATVFDYYQPLSLFDDAIAALAVSWASLCLALLLIALRAKLLSLGILRHALLLALIAILGWPLAASLDRVNRPQPNSALTLHEDVFVGGLGGYKVYRIPGLQVLPAGSMLANGQRLGPDRILAFAEARRDGALDTGVIDLVLKHSDDGGRHWSDQRVVCRYETEGVRGKCGNATPVYDAQAGTLHLAFNTSSGSQPSKRVHNSMLISSLDGGESWSAPRQLASDNLVFGPGHGIQKMQSPAAGRLLLPGYVDDHAIVLFSDDGGNAWTRSAALDTGNESELAELADGRLYLTTRHRAPIGRAPDPNGRLYALSRDGGLHWTPTALDESLPTPVCQASVASQSVSGSLLFSNPAHTRARVNMTVRRSIDGGNRWTEKLAIYPGPAGYSVLGTMSNSDILVLYERGNMAYSERISLASLTPEALQPTPGS